MRAMKWMIVILSVAVLAVVVLWVTARIIYPTEAQRQAVVELERWPDYAGENAFPLLWTLNRAVPDEEIARVLAEDVATVEAKLSEPLQFEARRSGHPSDWPSAAERYDLLTPSDEDRALFCPNREPGCLAHVRGDLERLNGLMERYASLLDRVERLQDFGYIQSTFPPSVYSPIPSVGDAYLLRTRHAVQFANGQGLEAVAAVCRDLMTWRRLGARTDSLIYLMVGIAQSGINNGQLLAEMLVELPVDMPLPSACEEALSPPAAIDQTMCNAMRGEFAMNQHWLEWQLDTTEMGVLDRMTAGLLTDREAEAGARAETYLYLCRHPAERESEAVPDGANPERSMSLRRLACVGSIYTCVFQALNAAGYWDYQLRVLDHGARLRALGTLAWMRAQAGQGSPPEALLAARPDALKDPTDELSFSPDGKSLRVGLRWARRGEHWSIPLPPALYAGVQPAAAASR